MCYKIPNWVFISSLLQLDLGQISIAKILQHHINPMDVKQEGRQRSTFRHLRCVYKLKLIMTCSATM